jgi:hypothetical protein
MKLDNNQFDDTTETENVKILAEKFDYDTDEINRFLDLVFADVRDDENILCWMSKSNVPAYPMSDSALINKLTRVPLPKSLYFSTATAGVAPDGKLYNRKNLFKRFYVLVLDDIGTKVPVEKLPEGFEPTYIIESSAGNYQYGYVLETPIDILEHAEALVHAVYTAGVSDAGGKMANKLVRLPAGVNGKVGLKGEFHVKLVKSDGRLWTPEAILEKLDLDVTWEELKTNAPKARQRLNTTRGTAPYLPEANFETVDGIIDPALEWMYQNKMVVQESSNWFTIKCPWGDLHSSGDGTAGYSPVGYGEGTDKFHRAFHCFHDHCSGHNTQSFLSWYQNMTGDKLPVSEYSNVIRKYVIDVTQNGIWDITMNSPLFTPMTGARLLLNGKILLPNDAGEFRRVPEISYLLNSEQAVKVHGQQFDPSTPSKIIVDSMGAAHLNTFHVPLWGDGKYDTEQVNFFTEYLNYLIPHENEAEYFLDWMACKAQDMSFRGLAIIMVALAQGTGRTTLGKLIGRIFGDNNVENVRFDTLTGDATFNEYLTKPFIITDETLAIGKDDSIYKVYERVKEIVDTTPKKIRVNPKYGTQRVDMCYSSYLMFSNHIGAMIVDETDRRFHVISNTRHPAPPEYFAMVNRRLNDKNDDWPKHVWRFLRQRKVDPSQMVKPAELNAAKAEMITGTKNPLTMAIELVVDNWKADFICAKGVREVLDSTTLFRIDKNIVERHVVKRITAILGVKGVRPVTARKFKVAGMAVQVVAKADRVGEKHSPVNYALNNIDSKEADDYINRMRHYMTEENIKKLRELVIEELEFNNMI